MSGEDAGLLHLDEEVEPVTIRLRLPHTGRSSASDLGQVYLAWMCRLWSELQEARSWVCPLEYRYRAWPVVVFDLWGACQDSRRFASRWEGIGSRSQSEAVTDRSPVADISRVTRSRCSLYSLR